MALVLGYEVLIWESLMMGEVFVDGVVEGDEAVGCARSQDEVW